MGQTMGEYDVSIDVADHFVPHNPRAQSTESIVSVVNL